MGQKNSSKRHLQTLTPLQILMNACQCSGNRALRFSVPLAAELFSFQHYHSLVCSVQHTSPVTAKHWTACSKETPKINSFLFLAQRAAQHPPLVSEICTGTQCELSSSLGQCWAQGAAGLTAGCSETCLTKTLLSSHLRSIWAGNQFTGLNYCLNNPTE